MARIRYTKDETRLLDAANRLIDNPSATPGETLKALRCIERLDKAVQRRAADREEAVPPATEPAEPSVDELVADLEAAEKRPLQVIENKGPEKPINAVNGSGQTNFLSDVPEATQTVLEPSTAFCGFCSAAGQWNTRYPVGQEDGVLLCPACFGKMCAADMLKASAASLHRQNSWLYEKGEDPNTFDLSAVHGTVTSDYQKSVLIWERQAAEDADRRVQEAAERDRAEAAFHRNRADFISRGGRL